MRRYEVACVLAPTLSTEEVEQTVESFKKVAEDKGATVVDVDSWGKRRLAFPVKKHTEGYYVVYTLDEEAAEAATEMERRFKVTDPVIRFLTVRIDEAVKRAAKLQARRDARKKIRRAAAAAKAAEETPSEAEEAKAEAAPASSSEAKKAEAEAAPASSSKESKSKPKASEKAEQGKEDQADDEDSSSKEKE